MALDASPSNPEPRLGKSALLSLSPELLGIVVATLDRPALWSLLVTCRSLKMHAERKIYETFYMRRYIRTKAIVFRAVERIIDNPDLAVCVRRLDLRATWSTNNMMFLKLSPRLLAALQATKQLESLAFPHDFPSSSYTRALPDIVLPRLKHLNMHHVYHPVKAFCSDEIIRTHDTVPWIRKHIGPLTHVELRSACYDSAAQQADLILNTAESQLPVVDAKYFRSSGSILASLLLHTVAGTADRKKLAHGGTIHVEPVEVGDTFPPSLLHALVRSNHLIGTLVLDMDAAYEASATYERCLRTWMLDSLRRIVISTSEENVSSDYDIEELITVHTNLFKLLSTPALETLEVVSLLPIRHAGRLAEFLCSELGPGCPSLQAVKVNDVARVRTSASSWGAGCWPAAEPLHWPFDAPPGFEERPRAWEYGCCEERRSVKTARDIKLHLYDEFDYDYFKTYAVGDENYGKPDNPEDGWWDTEDEVETGGQTDTEDEVEEGSQTDTEDEVEEGDQEE